jgi:hypothetical protein
MPKGKSTSAPCTPGGKCKDDSECCSANEHCDVDNQLCVPHQADPISYENGSNCVKTCSITLPKGAKPYCYANDDEHPNEIQICGYEKDGFLIAADGCCDKICPSEQCPEPLAKPAPPEQPRPKNAPYKPKKKKTDDTSQPLPMLIKIMLILFAILLVAAAIFLSVG